MGRSNGSLLPRLFRYTEDAMPEPVEPKYIRAAGSQLDSPIRSLSCCRSRGTAFMAISGLRLLIGIRSLAAATKEIEVLGLLHVVGLRIPGGGMTLFLGFRDGRLGRS